MTGYARVREKETRVSACRCSACKTGRGAALILLITGLFAFAGGCEESGSGASGPPAHASDKRVVLNISVEDATRARPAQGFTVRVPGDSASWVPDLAWGGASRAFGEYRVGREHVFYVQFDSTGGRRTAVAFEMQPDMISGVAASTTRLTVYDDSLVARGPAVPGHRQCFER